MLVAILLFAVNYLGKPWLVLLLCAVLVAAGVELASVKFLPLLDSAVSARPHAEFMRNDQHPDRIFTYELRRSWTYGLTFYFRRELPEWSPNDPIPALVLTTPDGLEQIKKLGRFRGELEETRPGLVYVPIGPMPGLALGRRRRRNILKEEVDDLALVAFPVVVGHVAITLPLAQSSASDPAPSQKAAGFDPPARAGRRFGRRA